MQPARSKPHPLTALSPAESRPVHPEFPKLRRVGAMPESESPFDEKPNVRLYAAVRDEAVEEHPDR